MMSMWKTVFFIRQDHETPEAYSDMWQRAKEIKDFVISTLEASIILGAIKAASNVSQYPLPLIMMYLAGWGALGLYLLTGLKFFLAVWIEERGPDPKKYPRLRRFLEKFVFSLATAAIAIGIPYFIPALVATVIENNLFN